VHFGQAQLDARGGRLHGNRGAGNERAQCRLEAGDADRAHAELGDRGQLLFDGPDPAQDLHGSSSQELTGRGQSYAATDPLGQRHSDVRLESREVVADRRLGVVQLAGGRRNRPVLGDRGQRPQADELEHSSMISMDRRKGWHLTHRLAESRLGP
jgi:hypothetical protein